MPIELEIKVMGRSGPAFAVAADQDDRFSAWAGVDFALGLYCEQIGILKFVSWLLEILVWLRRRGEEMGDVFYLTMGKQMEKLGLASGRRQYLNEMNPTEAIRDLFS